MTGLSYDGGAARADAATARLKKDERKPMLKVWDRAAMMDKRLKN
jgi:hypothetical protein